MKESSLITVQVFNNDRSDPKLLGAVNIGVADVIDLKLGGRSTSRDISTLCSSPDPDRCNTETLVLDLRLSDDDLTDRCGRLFATLSANASEKISASGPSETSSTAMAFSRMDVDDLTSANSTNQLSSPRTGKSCQAQPLPQPHQPSDQRGSPSGSTNPGRANGPTNPSQTTKMTQGTNVDDLEKGAVSGDAERRVDCS